MVAFRVYGMVLWFSYARLMTGISNIGELFFAAFSLYWSKK